MSGMDGIRQRVTPFDGFLYADLGQDRTGNAVSVLSALARLGLDPWVEAAGLSAMSQKGAREHLGLLLSRFSDVPALGRDPGAIISRLVDLLPRAPATQAYHATVRSAGTGVFGAGTIILGLMVILFLAQAIILGFDGPGR